MTYHRLNYLAPNYPLDSASIMLMYRRSQLITEKFSSPAFSFTFGADNTPLKAVFDVSTPDNQIMGHLGIISRNAPFNKLVGVFRYVKPSAFDGYINIHLVQGIQPVLSMNNAIYSMSLVNGDTDKWDDNFSYDFEPLDVPYQLYSVWISCTRTDTSTGTVYLYSANLDFTND
jgi:hypothetical protein